VNSTEHRWLGRKLVRISELSLTVRQKNMSKPCALACFKSAQSGFVLGAISSASPRSRREERMQKRPQNRRAEPVSREACQDWILKRGQIASAIQRLSDSAKRELAFQGRSGWAAEPRIRSL
jgi:hypothetical protein